MSTETSWGATDDLPPERPFAIGFGVSSPGWRNWQTQQTQNLPTKVVGVRSPPWAPLKEASGLVV